MDWLPAIGILIGFVAILWTGVAAYSKISDLKSEIGQKDQTIKDLEAKVDPNIVAAHNEAVEFSKTVSKKLAELTERHTRTKLDLKEKEKQLAKAIGTKETNNITVAFDAVLVSLKDAEDTRLETEALLSDFQELIEKWPDKSTFGLVEGDPLLAGKVRFSHNTKRPTTVQFYCAQCLEEVSARPVSAEYDGEKTHYRCPIHGEVATAEGPDDLFRVRFIRYILRPKDAEESP